MRRDCAKLRTQLLIVAVLRAIAIFCTLSKLYDCELPVSARETEELLHDLELAESSKIKLGSYLRSMDVSSVMTP